MFRQQKTCIFPKVCLATTVELVHSRIWIVLQTALVDNFVSEVEVSDPVVQLSLRYQDWAKNVTSNDKKIFSHWSARHFSGHQEGSCKWQLILQGLQIFGQSNLRVEMWLSNPWAAIRLKSWMKRWSASTGGKTQWGYFQATTYLNLTTNLDQVNSEAFGRLSDIFTHIFRGNLSWKTHLQLLGLDYSGDLVQTPSLLMCPPYCDEIKSLNLSACHAK